LVGSDEQEAGGLLRADTVVLRVSLAGAGPQFQDFLEMVKASGLEGEIAMDDRTLPFG
jgi:hypothetical protein